ncbi:tRNA-splicing ligase RtcB [Paenibacillus algorifonticola]|uniref:tRNA-splicing ligase RtcB n=1 Tax=Paenibacillus algorifonticola TaxID=684063 RepID=A0A1I2BBB6_9BACL|nr:RtcB family protein [Paenibacillus algorifonticola]SFE52440.1 tRNA-splicing ligase RtcB [Paenibacillus algorifonticola]
MKTTNEKTEAEAAAKGLEKTIQLKGKNHRELGLAHGKLHVFANDEVFAMLEPNAYTMADNNLRIPRNQYMSYTPDAHIGVGTCIGTTAVWNMKDGFISPSIVGSDIGCGMRVHTTPLHKRDIQDKEVRRALISAIEKYVPTHERTNTNYEDIDIMSVVQHGLKGLPAKYVPNEQWLTHVEQSAFGFDHKALEHLPPRIKRSAHGQLGSLGNGNHFIEIQYLDINEEYSELAEKWGLFDGQVVVMIHSGSRAWGAMVGREHNKVIKEAMHQWGISNPDPNLVYAPIASHEGQMYLNLMYSALNFAVSNRHMIAFGVQQAFRDVFGPEMELPVLYDLMHNYALKEFHRKQPMLVHRKGATRALPPNHFLNTPAYKETGHPALIPGSMGTASYIMVGKDEGLKNFYSICHGAGRARSRRATKQLVTVDQFEQSLRVGSDDEILVNHRSLQDILDECPQAYKDVDQIIDSVVGASLAAVVAKCQPMAAIKGT